jgi:hypothetical protein
MKSVAHSLLRLPLWIATVILVLVCGMVLWVHDQFPEEWLD